MTGKVSFEQGPDVVKVTSNVFGWGNSRCQYQGPKVEDCLLFQERSAAEVE